MTKRRTTREATIADEALGFREGDAVVMEEPAVAEPLAQLSAVQAEMLDKAVTAQEATQHEIARDTFYGSSHAFDVPAVYKSMARILAAFATNGIDKGRKNSEQGYAFRGIDQLLERLSPMLAEEKLFVLPSVLEREQHEYKTRNGGRAVQVVLKVDFNITSAEDASQVTVTTYGEGADSSDKGTNKALTAAFKYAMLTAFAIPIPTSEETDADATSGGADGIFDDDAPAATKQSGYNEWVGLLRKEKTYDALVAAVQAGTEENRAALRKDRAQWDSLKAEVTRGVTK